MIIAADFETSLISLSEPIPRPIALAWYDGKDVTIRTKLHIGLYESVKELFQFAKATGTKIVWHNAAFDLSVIWKMAQTHRDLKAELVELVEMDLMSDTMIREMLYDISTRGFVRKKGYSLANLVKERIGRERNDKEDGWRLRYAELEGVPLGAWPTAAIDYIVNDVQDTYDLWMSQEEVRTNTGPGSMNTETLQIGSSLALAWMAGRGIMTNQQEIRHKINDMTLEIEKIKGFLAAEGFMRYSEAKGYTRNKIQLQQYVSEKFDAKKTAPTATYPEGQVAVSKGALQQFADDRIISQWLKYSTLEKQMNTYLKNLLSDTKIIYPQYSILKVTGRTSSFGGKLPGTNIQNIPGDLNIRECIIPREGYVLGSVDYSNLELCTGAQTLYNIYGESKLLDEINSGKEPVDLHGILGQEIKQIDQGEKTDKEYRTMAKPIGLGALGGLGKQTLINVAKTVYGVTFTEEEVTKFKKVYSEKYPETINYLHQYPHRNRIAENRYAYECNGRYRNDCGYSEFCNGKAMQSPAADGAKVALWECFKRNMPMLMFIHDEIIFEFPKAKAKYMLKRAQNIMIDGMQVVTPHTRITTEGHLFRYYWTKDESQFTYTSKKWKDPVITKGEEE